MYVLAQDLTLQQPVLELLVEDKLIVVLPELVQEQFIIQHVMAQEVVLQVSALQNMRAMVIH